PAQHATVLGGRAEIQDTQDQLKSSLQMHQTPRPGGVTTLKPLETAQLSKQMADLEVETISLQAREQTLQQRIARLKRSMASMGPRELELAGLARNSDIQSRLVGVLAERLTTARLAEQTQIRGIQVIDLAALPRQPSAKQPLKLLLLGVLGGLGLGIAGALLREYTTQVIE